MKNRSVDEILAEQVLPVVAIDNQGLITFVNKSFTNTYGWESSDLVGQVITIIMPPYMRDAHNFGFSRFLVTEHARILDKPLSLPVLNKNGKVTPAEHYITGDKQKGYWRFAATISPASKDE